MKQLQISEQHFTVETLYVDKRASTWLVIFWAGFIFYSIAFALHSLSNSFYRIEALALVIMVVGAVGIVQFRIENQYLKTVYILYCLWVFTVIVRGFHFTTEYLYSYIFDAWYGILPYFAPIVLLFPINVAYLKKIFTVITILAIVYIACALVFWGRLDSALDDEKSRDLLEILSKTLAVPCGFLLITYIYHSSTKKLLAFGVIALCLLLAVLRARRSIMFMNLTYLLGFYLVYLYVHKTRFSSFFFSSIIIVVLSVSGVALYQANKHKAFSLITSRIDEDTRSYVEESFDDDLTTTDWIVGKGMDGKYFCPGVDESSDEYTGGYRTVIETDYLNIILKGGLISICLILLIMIPAIIKGFFYSKNVLSKASAAWILIWLITLYPATVHTFTLNYLLVWVCIGICYSPEIRYMPEALLKETFSGKTKRLI